MLAAVAMWVATTAMAQSAAPKPGNMAKDADPGWEAMTVKPSDPNDKFDMMSTRGRHVVIRNKTVEAMLRLAYGVQRSQIVGAPDWTRTEHFDIDGVPTEYPECLVFEQNPDGLINRVSVFIKQLGN